jgi:hypothetical protein
MCLLKTKLKVSAQKLKSQLITEKQKKLKCAEEDYYRARGEIA